MSASNEMIAELIKNSSGTMINVLNDIDMPPNENQNKFRCQKCCKDIWKKQQSAHESKCKPVLRLSLILNNFNGYLPAPLLESIGTQANIDVIVDNHKTGKLFEPEKPLIQT